MPKHATPRKNRKSATKKELARTGKAAFTERDALTQYFKDISNIPLLSREEEKALGIRIAGHVSKCIWTIQMLLTTSLRILEEPETMSQLPPKRLRIFKMHPYVAGHMKTLDVPGDLKLREGALHLQRTFNPESLRGKALKNAVVAMVSSPTCASLLSTFVSRQAKRDFDSMVGRNLRLVVDFTKHFHGIPKEELIQEGNFGLMRAVAKFDPSQGFRFSTYAVWWIRSFILRYIANNLRTVRLPVEMHEMHETIRKTTSSLHNKSGHEPTLDEIAREMRVPVEVIEERSTDLHLPLSLDIPVRSKAGHKTACMHVDNLRVQDWSHPCDRMILEENIFRLQEAIKDLTPREQDILRRYFGLNGSTTENLREIGPSHELSRERIRQIKALALRRLRERLELAA